MLILRKQIHEGNQIYSYGCKDLTIPKWIPLGWIPKEGSKFTSNERNYIVKSYPVLDDVGSFDSVLYKIYEEVG